MVRLKLIVPKSMRARPPILNNMCKGKLSNILNIENHGWLASKDYFEIWLYILANGRSILCAIDFLSPSLINLIAHRLGYRLTLNPVVIKHELTNLALYLVGRLN